MRLSLPPGASRRAPRVWRLGLILSLCSAFALGIQACGGSTALSTCDETSVRAAISMRTSVSFTKGCTVDLSAPLVINHAITLDGNGHTVTLDGQNETRVLAITSQPNSAPFNVTLNDLTITKGAATSGGAGLWNTGANVTITNTTFSDNEAAPGNGGALVNEPPGSVDITDSTFTGNSAGVGGAIYSPTKCNNTGTTCPDDVTITDTIFTDNSAGYGGAISFDGPATVTIAGSAFTSNSAAMGGAIYSGNEGLINDTINNSTFTGNSASGDGGAIKTISGDLTIANGATFTGNHASTGSGGAISAMSTTVAITDSAFDANAANSEGGGLEIVEPGGAGDSLNISASTFSSNTAAVCGRGGALAVNALTNMPVTIDQSVLTQNQAGEGGGMYLTNSTLAITQSELANNAALDTVNNTGSCPGTFAGAAASPDGGGGGIQIDSGTAKIINSTLAYNTSDADTGYGGGAIDAFGATLNIYASTIAANTALLGGGYAIYDPGKVVIQGSIVASNLGGNCAFPTGSPQSADLYDLEYTPPSSGSDSCHFAGKGSLTGKDPLLDPMGLQSNGLSAGQPQTIALQSGSPAIDQIPQSYGKLICPSTDQRGQPRPDPSSPTEGACDMGAYESDY